MEGVEGWSVNDCALVADEHAFGIVEGVYNHGAGVAQSDLEDGGPVFAPPGLADGGMVVSEFEEMACYWESTGYLENALYVRDISGY